MVALPTGSWLTSFMGESAERQAWRGFGAVGSGWKAALEFFSRYVYNEQVLWTWLPRLLKLSKDKDTR